jgi:hypothetical protein
MAMILAAGEAEAIKVDNQAHVQELSSLVQEAMTQTVSTSEALSAQQINSQIQSTV